MEVVLGPGWPGVLLHEAVGHGLEADFNRKKTSAFAGLIGNGPDVLTRVSMVGNDLKLDEGVGTCGKDGQAVPVGVGIPTIKIDRLTVGGTAKRETGGFMQ